MEKQLVQQKSTQNPAYGYDIVVGAPMAWKFKKKD